MHFWLEFLDLGFLQIIELELGLKLGSGRLGVGLVFGLVVALWFRTGFTFILITIYFYVRV